jgi:hypothetical protein
MNPVKVLGIAGLIALLASVASGGETAISINRALDQERQDMAQLENGKLVFVFEDESVAGGRILMRRFDASLGAAEGEQQVNFSATGERCDPVVAALAGGGFVAAWSAGGMDGDSYGVAFRRFDAAGVPLDAGDVLANSITSGAQFRPQVAALKDGGFVLCWVGQTGGIGQEVFYRRFAASGSPLDPADLVANGIGNDGVTQGDQGNPGIAALRDGGFVIVYEDRVNNDVYGVRFAANGAAVDAPGEAPGNKQFLVNVSTAFEQSAPAIAGLTNGGFVATFSTEPDGTAASRRVVGRLFDSNGIGGAEFLVGSHTNRWQDSRVAGLANGDFAVAYQARVVEPPGPASSWAVFGQRFGATGTARSGTTQVNTFDSGNQDTASISGLSNGGYVVAWQSFGQDAGGYGIFGSAQAPFTILPGTLSIARVAGDQKVVVNFAGQSGCDHLLEGSANARDWIPLVAASPADGTFTYVEPKTNSVRLYRVQSQ